MDRGGYEPVGQTVFGLATAEGSWDGLTILAKDVIQQDHPMSGALLCLHQRPTDLWVSWRFRNDAG